MSRHAWLDTAVFYEIYPQSFNDTNADGIGDLRGIIEKLDYIQELGCDALWLNPCFDSPFGDAGYDIADYYKVAPRYGTNEDLKDLFSEAHRHGMHILLDLVPGHTSIEHPWFKESCKGAPNEFTDRYVWTDNVFTPLPNAIRGFSERDGACYVNFFSHQPALNYGYYQPEEAWQQPMDAPGPQATLRAMEDVMAFWLGMGCDGFRVDMAGSLVKNDPEQLGTIKLWQQVRTFLDEEFPNAVLVSEWGDPQRSLAGGFHMDFLLQFGPSHYNDLFRCEEPFFSARGLGSAKEFVETYRMNVNQTDGKGLMCIPSGNHDMDRLARALPDTEEQKMVFAFLLSMPGAPFIYYGDEIGMRHVEGLYSVEGSYWRTGARSPMQWNHSTNAGFSTAPKDALYIMQDPDKHRPTVESAMQDKHSLFYEIQKLIKIRRNEPALCAFGKIEFQSADYPLVYKRVCDTGSILVILNPGKTPTEFEGVDLLGECIYSLGEPITQSEKSIHVPGQSAAFYRID